MAASSWIEARLASGDPTRPPRPSGVLKRDAALLAQHVRPAARELEPVHKLPAREQTTVHSAPELTPREQDIVHRAPDTSPREQKSVHKPAPREQVVVHKPESVNRAEFTDLFTVVHVLVARIDALELSLAGDRAGMSAEERKAYRRDWMRRKRAEGKP
jgi:hypothetical protein